MTNHTHDSDPQGEAVRLVRGVLQRSSGASAANDSKPSPKELQSARSRVHLSFGQALLSISTLPSVASISTYLDTGWSFIFGGFGLTLAVVGAFYIDRANALDKSKLKAN